MLQPGDQIGPFEVLNFIAAGGMGEVYRARHLQLETEVALKLLLSRHAMDQDSVFRLKREAELISKLAHPNIAKVLSVGLSDSGLPYIAMEFVPGRSLSALIDQGPLSFIETKAIFGQICDALTAAHDKGIIHRDLKPSNVIVAEDGATKLIDFGLAIISLSGVKEQELTRTGQLLGTPQYMAPEQCFGAPVDPRTDVYSLTCMLYEALTAMPVFTGESNMHVMIRHLNDTPSLAAAAIPAQIFSLLKKGLSKNPAERYQTAAAFKSALSDVETEPSHNWRARTSKVLRDTSFVPFLSALSFCAVVLAILISVWPAILQACARTLPASSMKSWLRQRTKASVDHHDTKGATIYLRTLLQLPASHSEDAAQTIFDCVQLASLSPDEAADYGQKAMQNAKMVLGNERYGRDTHLAVSLAVCRAWTRCSSWRGAADLRPFLFAQAVEEHEENHNYQVADYLLHQALLQDKEVFGGNNNSTAMMLESLGIWNAESGNHAGAIIEYNKALACAVAPDTRVEGATRRARSLVALNRIDEALQSLSIADRDAIDLFNHRANRLEQSVPRSVCHGYFSVRAEVCEVMRKYDEALACHKKALVLAREDQNKVLQANQLESLSRIARRVGQFKAATDYLAKSILLRDETGDAIKMPVNLREKALRSTTAQK